MLKILIVRNFVLRSLCLLFRPIGTPFCELPPVSSVSQNIPNSSGELRFMSSPVVKHRSRALSLPLLIREPATQATGVVINSVSLSSPLSTPSSLQAAVDCPVGLLKVDEGFPDSSWYSEFAPSCGVNRKVWDCTFITHYYLIIVRII